MRFKKRDSKLTVDVTSGSAWMMNTLESIGDAVIVTKLDGRIRFMNAVAERLTGWTAEEARRHRLDQVFVLINKLNGMREESPLQKALEQGHSVGLRNYTALISRAGEEKYISASTAPIRSPRGGFTGVVIVFRDINRLKLTGEQVIRERKNLETIFEYAPTGMVLIDPERVIKQANDTVLKIFSCEREAVLNQTFGEGFGCVFGKRYHQRCGKGPECDVNCLFMEMVEQVVETGEAVRGREYRHNFWVAGQERELWLRISLMPVYVNDERHVVIVLDEITEQKEAELALKRMKVLSEQARDIMLTVDTDGRIVEANQAALQAYGYTEAELLQCNLADLRKSASKDLAIMQLKTADHSGVLFETMHYRKDGTAFPVEVSNHGVNFSGDRVYLSIIRDITDRYQAQEALKESEKKFRELFNNAHDAICLFDLCGKIIEVNEEACRRYGYSREEFLEISVRQIIDLSVHNLAEMLKEIILQETRTFEMLHVMKDGRRVPVESNTHLFKLNGNQVILAVVRDMTERKRVERELRSAKEAAEIANVAKSEFLANMSHEIRTPLNGILGMTELTLMSKLEPEQKENLTIARNCAQGLIRVINDILDFSKLEAGKLNIECISFQLPQLIENVVRPHQVTADEKGVRLTYEIEPVIPEYLMGDPLRLQQVLNNLIGNAVKFTEIGAIRLGIRRLPTEQTGYCLEFAVSDTGIGIGDTEMDRLFKSFSQVDGSVTRRYGGTGLGLVISKRLVEMMGGAIWVESAKGRGSTFYFTVKLEADLGGRPVKTKREEPLPARHKALRILVVEDDLVNQAVTVQMLQKVGHTVAVAGNGEEALATLAQQRFDLVLMDIQTPKMDGLEATRQIRMGEKGTSAHLPIVALTAFALQGDRERFIAGGMDGYVAKPFSQERLFAEMDRVLGLLKNGPPTPVEPAGEKTVNGLRAPEETIDTDAIIEQLSRVERAIGKADLGKIERAAHQTKQRLGNGSLERLRKSLFKMEIAARKGDLTAVREIFMKLKAEFVEEFVLRRK